MLTKINLPNQDPVMTPSDRLPVPRPVLGAPPLPSQIFLVKNGTNLGGKGLGSRVLRAITAKARIATRKRRVMIITV